MMKMKNYRSLLWSVPLVLLAGCAGQQQKEIWVDTTDTGYSTAVPEQRASVVIYRQADAVSGPTVNIYINGQYSGSLQPNAYRQETVCMQNQKFHADFTKHDAAYRNKVLAGDYYNLPESTVSFFKVADDGRGNPVLKNVTPEQAEAEMKGVKRQNHTLSRVSGPAKCSEVLKKYNLQASALFKFDRAGYQDMLPEGRREVEAVSADIRSQKAKVTGVSVTGHTDPEGSPEYNNRLSLQRAQTVKRVLAESGLNSTLIGAEGRGESSLLVSDCRRKFPKNAQARQQCDQPNRRVEILLHGEK